MPPELIQQLAEGGMMIIPVGDEYETQKFMEVTKKDGKIHQKFITSVMYVPLTDLYKQVRNP